MSVKTESSGTDSRRERLCDVIDTWQAPLLRYATGILRDPGLSQDAVQEAFIALASRWRPGQVPLGEDHLRNWLYKVVHNQAVSILRKEDARQRTQERFARTIDPDAATAPAVWEDDGVDSAAQLRLIGASIAVLAPSRRQVLLLRLQQGLSHADISAITGHSVPHCRKLLHDAIRHLRSEVRRRLNTGEGMIHE